MQIERKIAFAPRTSDVACDVAALRGPCIACDGCKGLCPALIEVLTLPEAILKATSVN